MSPDEVGYSGHPKISLGAIIAVCIAALIVLGAGITLAFSSNATNSNAGKTDLPSSSVALSVDTKKLGSRVDDDAFGLSFEATVLTQPQFSAGNLSQYLKTLGPGVLRIGGNSSDDMFWTSTGETAPDWSKGTLNPQAMERLGAVAQRSGWKVLLGVNLKHADPTRAADEVFYAKKALGDKLKVVAIGNEPNVYYSDFPRYLADFRAYTTAIRAKVPNVSFVGPDTSSSIGNQQFMASFIESQIAQKDVVGLAQHRYAQTACSGRTTDISQLLSATVYAAEKKAADDFVANAKKLNAPAFLTETNSVSCDGQAGVSDTYAATLWALGHGLSETSAGVDGVYFHGSIAECGSDKPDFKYYSPLCAAGKKDAAKGKLSAQPEFYALLALGQLGGGNFVNVNNPSWQNLHAFAVKEANKLTILIVNVADPVLTGSTQVHMTVNGTYARAGEYQLANANQQLESKSGITLGKQTVKADGKFPKLSTNAVSFDGNAVDVLVPAGTTSIVVLS